MLSVIFILL